jgi:hypothetical protein
LGFKSQKGLIDEVLGPELHRFVRNYGLFFQFGLSLDCVERAASKADPLKD